MTPIEEYILLTQEERQTHLRLEESCIERGGFSTYCKGLMAHILDTSIPSGKKIHVCHACHNAKCSNPNHLYWGTPRENQLDAISQGKPISPYHAVLAKHGVEVANAMNRRTSESARRAGKGNIGTKKSEEHKRKIAESVRRKHKERIEASK